MRRTDKKGVGIVATLEIVSANRLELRFETITVDRRGKELPRGQKRSCL